MLGMESFNNILGAPAVAFTTIFLKLRLQLQSRRVLRSVTNVAHWKALRDVLYVLECLDNHLYPVGFDATAHTRTNRALLRGALLPFTTLPQTQSATSLKEDMAQLTAYVAAKLKLQRKEVEHRSWTDAASLSLIIFTLVKDPATTNAFFTSILLGLCLAHISLIPVASFLFDDPHSDLACTRLLKDWLSGADALCERYLESLEEYTARLNDLVDPNGQHILELHASNLEYTIGEPVSWNLRCCTVQHSLLKIMTAFERPPTTLPNHEDADKLGIQLASRPSLCSVMWLVSQQIVNMIFMYLLGSSILAHTPDTHYLTTLCMTWYFLGFFQWVIFGVWNDPPVLLRMTFCILNNLATMNVVAIILLRTASSLTEYLQIFQEEPHHGEISVARTLPPKMLSFIAVFCVAIYASGPAMLLVLWKESRQS